ncbi:unnamed protein product [Rhizoctonia solani]|uniref:Uncharacterized protein n=1 Tax=Rhizoctonia solani TaxID=456999 RepID=A0A8H3C171_9AGAM|nr:unnamed protein product [Rhizoctonia solani]
MNKVMQYRRTEYFTQPTGTMPQIPATCALTDDGNIEIVAESIKLKYQTSEPLPEDADLHIPPGSTAGTLEVPDPLPSGPDDALIQIKDQHLVIGFNSSSTVHVSTPFFGSGAEVHFLKTPDANHLTLFDTKHSGLDLTVFK